MNALAPKMRELTKNKCFNEDLAALHVNKSEIVQANVPKEIVNGFLRSHKHLRVLNLTIQTHGWIMEESAYSNYEDPFYVPSNWMAGLFSKNFYYNITTI